MPRARLTHRARHLSRRHHLGRLLQPPHAALSPAAKSDARSGLWHGAAAIPLVRVGTADALVGQDGVGVERARGLARLPLRVALARQRRACEARTHRQLLDGLAALALRDDLGRLRLDARGGDDDARDHDDARDLRRQQLPD
eukprot:136200-Prymnesium_polylepis.1